MSVPLTAPETALLRFKLVIANQAVAADPGVSNDLKLTRAPEQDAPAAGAFYYRDKLSGGPLIFKGQDFTLLYGIETSNARCQVIGLLIEHRPHPAATWEQWRGSFSCNDCEFDVSKCQASLAPSTADPYTKLLESWEQEYDILLTPGSRVAVNAQLAQLAAGTEIEFKRIDQNETSDYVGTEGWSLFYIDSSDIYRGQGRGFQKSTNAVVFRYRQRAVALVPVAGSNPVTYGISNRSGAGWEPLIPYGAAIGNGQVNVPALDYVKTPSIAGFKAYKLTGSGSNVPFLRTEESGPGNGRYIFGSTAVGGGLGPGTNGQLTNLPPRPGGYLGEFLSLDCGHTPADVGLDPNDWVPMTGPDGGVPGLGGGANNAEACNGTGLTVREIVDETHDRVIYWRFGNFTFGRCFRYIDGLYSLLAQTVAPFGGLSLLPPSAEQLSEFLTATTNPATQATGAANEIPRLLLSAGSDITRYGFSEPATRLLISLKQFLADSAWWDTGWFIDPVTGWLRFEHRAYLEAKLDAGAVIDLRSLDEVLLSSAYSYRTQSLPRYEGLTVTNASTEDAVHEAYFGKSSIDYGTGACVNGKQGSNKVEFTVARLSGDIPAGVLNGGTIPDSTLFVLAPDVNFRLPNANRELSASQLQYRYWRRGRVASRATVEGPAPYQAPNTVTGALPPYGIPLPIESVRPQREQAGISVRVPLLATLSADNRYTTNLGAGGQLGKAEITLRTRVTTITVWLNVPDYTADPPTVRGSFDDSFEQSFHK